MAIPDHACTNFQTLLRAAEAGYLALMECLDAATREPRYVPRRRRPRRQRYRLHAFGHLAPGNPFESYLPPTKGGGFVEPE